MPSSDQENLLAQLAGTQSSDPASNPWQSVEADSPSQIPKVIETSQTVDSDATIENSGEQKDQKLNEMLQRINRLTQNEPGSIASESTEEILPEVQSTISNKIQSALKVDSNDNLPVDSNSFLPLEPRSLVEAQLTESEVEALILKYLLARGDASGRGISEQVKLPFILIDGLLRGMKQQQLVGHKGSATMNDYIYLLTDIGRERARRLSQISTYFGAAPVSLKDYIESVHQQSLTVQHPTRDDLARAFSDLLINPRMLTRLGPAINSGRGLFLYGAPGNGKTSIAERVTAAFGQSIWIPRAIGCDGEVIRLFDPSNHIPDPLRKGSGLLDHQKVDQRWIRVLRPTIVVGGELTMENLEVMLNHSTGISEAPLQMKSNCGTLVIDDFGRQKMSTDKLLNRWIIPLEKRYDFLNLPGGKKIQVPFDQLIIFSTNLEPKDLVDDAFLRRIPYKIEVTDPSEDDFRQLFLIMSPIIGVKFDQEALDYLIENHYKAINRPMRCCQPRDLLQQVKNYCYYVNEPALMTPETMDFAVENYFTVM